MNATITAIYEQGVLRPLTPLNLPTRARVQVQITQVEPEPDERTRVRRALLDAGIIQPKPPLAELPKPISQERRDELARIFAAGGPLSEIIIAEREGR